MPPFLNIVIIVSMQLDGRVYVTLDISLMRKEMTKVTREKLADF